MMYKTVAGPVALTIGKGDSYETAVSQYASIINHEAQQGWELVLIQEIPVQRDNGCMAGCLSTFGIGSRYETMTFNMLVFANKNDNSGYTTVATTSSSPVYSNGMYANTGYQNANYGNTQYNVDASSSNAYDRKYSDVDKNRNEVYNTQYNAQDNLNNLFNN